MRKTLAILVSAVLLLWPVSTLAATETKFPTAFDNPEFGGDTAFTNPGFAIDGTDSHATACGLNGDGAGTVFQCSISYKTWQSAGLTYTSLILRVDSDASGSVKGGLGGAAHASATVDYSLNSGSTWNNIRGFDITSVSSAVQSGGWTRVTDDTSIPANQNLASLRVRCVGATDWTQVSGPGFSNSDCHLWDIRTIGTSAQGRNQVVIVGH